MHAEACNLIHGLDSMPCHNSARPPQPIPSATWLYPTERHNSYSPHKLSSGPSLHPTASFISSPRALVKAPLKLRFSLHHTVSSNSAQGQMQNSAATQLLGCIQSPTTTQLLNSIQNQAADNLLGQIRLLTPGHVADQLLGYMKLLATWTHLPWCQQLPCAETRRGYE